MNLSVRPTTDNRWTWACPTCRWQVSLRSLRTVTSLARLHAGQAHPRHAR